MFRKGCLALAAGAFLLATTPEARADDILRLGGTPGPALAQPLGLATLDDADTELAHFRGGFRGGYGGGFYRGGYGGFYRGGYGGFYRGGYVGYGGFHRGFYGGPRVSIGIGWGGGYYRPYNNFYRPAYYGYSGFGYSGYYPSYSYPVYSYSYYSPCSVTQPAMPYATFLNGGTTPYVATTPGYGTPSAPTYVLPPSPAPGSPAPPVVTPESPDGTYRYDGGPGVAPPLPEGVPAAPAGVPGKPALPRDGRFVSLPASPAPAFPAYGEAPRTSTPDAATRFVSAPAPAATRPAFPAFGEGAPRK